jgi:hypothetical protein
VARLGAGQMEFSPQVSLGDLSIERRHFRRQVAEQFDERGKAPDLGIRLTTRIGRVVWSQDSLLTRLRLIVFKRMTPPPLSVEIQAVHSDQESNQ